VGDLERAAAGLERLARARPRSRRADDARWFAAWAWIRLGEAARADAALRRLERTSAPRSLYWRARITAAPTARDALLRRAVTADPIGYYGLLACARLGGGERNSGPGGAAVAQAAPGGPKDAAGEAKSRHLRDAPGGCVPPPLPAGPPPPDLDRLPQAPLLRGAAALAAAGLREEAVAELAAVASSRRNRPAAGAVAELAAFLGDPLLPFRVARDQLGPSRRSLPWSFPQAWPHWVRPAAGSARVDPALLLAIMRRESGFRTEARSAAGAVGLLQIIPGTAARLTSLLALPSPVAERLEDPEVNIPLGAAYLSLLVERFGEPLLAVAAYNAGPGAVLRWQRERPDLPLDEWVESIPFKETREYVKAVVENWAGMRAAAGEAPPTLDPGAKVPAPGAGVGF
jgi:soluble lytic murein transglycosylase